MLPFTYRFGDLELQRDFERFINNNLGELFSSLRVRKTYTIGYIDARAVVRKAGADRRTIGEFINAINTKQPQNRDSTDPKYENFHRAAILETINLLANGNWRQLMNWMKEVTRLLHLVEFKYNIVWYTYFKERATQF